MAMSRQERTAALFTKGTTTSYVKNTEPWTCQLCRERYPVTSLARDCEDGHEQHVRRTGPG